MRLPQIMEPAQCVSPLKITSIDAGGNRQDHDPVGEYQRSPRPVNWRGRNPSFASIAATLGKSAKLVLAATDRINNVADLDQVIKWAVSPRIRRLRQIGWFPEVQRRPPEALGQPDAADEQNSHQQCHHDQGLSCILRFRRSKSRHPVADRFDPGQGCAAGGRSVQDQE